jgi:hypothetical protein
MVGQKKWLSSCNKAGGRSGETISEMIMADNATTSRETSADDTTRIHQHPKKLGFEEEKGQLREWTTVARDRPA